MESVAPEAKRLGPKPLSSWAKIVKAFDRFPPPRLSIDFEGERDRDTWIFRGLKSADYHLEPSIEWTIRPSEQWAAFEPLLLGEFQSKARLYRAHTTSRLKTIS